MAGPENPGPGAEPGPPEEVAPRPGKLAVYFLCAGHGRRLQPLTSRIPKPLLPFQGRSALAWNVDKVRRLYPTRLLCNTHHLWEKTEKEAFRLGLSTLYEREILGTGGCFLNAAHLLEGCDTLLVHNGDLIHDIDLAALLRVHRESGRLATLAGYFSPEANTLSMGLGSRLLGVHKYQDFDHREEMARLTFCGIAAYDIRFLSYCKKGEEDIKRFWLNALLAGEEIGIHNCTSTSTWLDFGTPQGLWEAAKTMMEWRKEFSFGYRPLLREMRPYVSNEAEAFGLPEPMRNVVIVELPGFAVPSDTNNCILGQDFKWDILP